MEQVLPPGPGWPRCPLPYRKRLTMDWDVKDDARTVRFTASDDQARLFLERVLGGGA